MATCNFPLGQMRAKFLIQTDSFKVLYFGAQITKQDNPVNLGAVYSVTKLGAL